MTFEFVLDCSATLPWVFASEATINTDKLLDELAKGARAWVPALWHLELANVLVGAKRKKRIDQFGIEKFFVQLSIFEIFVDSETITTAWSKTMALAEMYHLTQYDAVYLELSLRKGVPLASFDAGLCAAVKSSGGSLLLT